MSWSCPLHGPEKIKQGKFGLYCATKLQDGTWCREKPPRAAQGSLPAPPPPSPQTSRNSRYAACLAFAGSIYQGGGSEVVGEALKLAALVFEGWPD